MLKYDDVEEFLEEFESEQSRSYVVETSQSLRRNENRDTSSSEACKRRALARN